METRELAHRTADGVEVTLRWHPTDGRVSVVVHDTRLGESFELAVAPGDSALDVFEHPYAYASTGTTILSEVAPAR
jgi:hypothetical protein